MQLYGKVSKDTMLYRKSSILSYLNALLLPIFVASVISRKTSVLAEALLFGTMLCCVVNPFIFDTKAVLSCAALAFFVADRLFANILGKRIIILTLIQALVHEYMREELTRSLDLADSVVFSQMVAIVLHLATGGYKRSFSVTMLPLVDFSVNLGYVLFVLLAVIVAEEITCLFPRTCIKRKLTLAARVILLLEAIYRFTYWGVTTNTYKMGVTPFTALLKLYSTREAIITLGAWLATSAVCVTCLYFMSPVVATQGKTYPPKSPMITVLRKGLHFVLLINAAIAIYLRQHILLGMTLYLLFVGLMSIELLRFYSYMPSGINRRISNLYKAFGEVTTLRTLVLPQVWLVLAAGIPLWVELTQKNTVNFTRAYLGLAVVALSDAAAAFLGSRATKMQCHEKSLVGSIAFFICTAMALGTGMFLQFGNKLGLAHAGAAIIVALVTTVVEAGCPGIDNLNIAMVACAVYANIEKLL
ncbi:dolichol kinase [Babesia ovis]|uniref:dolichol kinase n=1 Tax=Babesia ovis TaxID=5869 RepID=A0A9W5WVJ7_BABOV|nr:dolichol kinase [Babesia ovis]